MGAATPEVTTEAPVLSGEAIPRQLSVSPGFLLSKAAELIEFRFAEALKPYGISPRGYGVLSYIVERGPQSQHRIAEHLRIDRTTMVGLIDSLEDMRLVDRVKDQTDRRRYAITLTAKGEDLFRRELSAVNEQVHAAALSMLSPAESDALIDYLRRMVTT